MNYRTFLICLFFSAFSSFLWAQQVQVSPTPDQIRALTPKWEGQRLEDGRPKTSDRLLERLANISLEEAWGVLRNEGYHNQFEGNWEVLHPDQVMTGRVVTAQYMPMRPEWDEAIKASGRAEGRSVGGTNSWPIDVLKEGDIYVADGYGKIVGGTLIGDNLGNSIYANSKRGVIFYGSLRDSEGLSRINGFNYWVKGYDPSFIQEMMLSSINNPIRIGRATVFPGDVVLAKKGGVVFIPPHLLEKVVITAEFIAMKDRFGHTRLREGKYTPGQIDGRWSDSIKEDFLNWVEANPELVPMTRSELENYLKGRTW